MLSGLDTGTPLPRPQKNRLPGGWVAVAVMATVALGGTYLWHAGQPAAAPAVAAADPGAAAGRRVESAPVSRKVDEVPAASTPPAAVIETVAAAAAVPTTPAAVSAPSKVAGPEAATPPSARSVPAAARITPARAQRSPTVVAEVGSTPRRTPPARLASKEPKLAAVDTRAGGGSSPDSDVDLLAAMVDHLQGTTKPSLPTASAATRAGYGERPVSIATLVRDCKRLGGSAAVQCRRQICENYWGKAQACPARLAPAKALALAKRN